MHVGGGLILLKALLSVQNLLVKLVQLDERAKDRLALPSAVPQFYVRPSVFSRLFAEWRLWRKCLGNDIVLCFHGLPPLFPLSAQVVVFIQNRILLEKDSISEYPLHTKIRLLIERMWLRLMHKRSFRYIVQTPSMANALKDLLGNDFEVLYLPFAVETECLQEKKQEYSKKNNSNLKQQYDFLYVASGDAHKNHVNLLKAWCLLAESGFKPSLALTVNPLLFPDIAEMIAKFSQEFSLNINNMGQLSSQDINLLYQSSGALIYPSSTESFGLPLIEAMVHKLPIIASELDYVRDVVVPVETFNPDSPVSIARAVRRFLDDTEPVIQLQSAEDFLAEVLK